MAHVFLSYAREDLARARDLAQALQSVGLTVWWDRSLLAGQWFGSAIAEELREAGAVVVLWSESSIESKWVVAEAREAMEASKLVPAFLDNVKPPLPFGGLQTETLLDWNGEPDDEPFLRLLGGVRAAIDAPVAAGPTVSTRQRWPHRWLIVVALGLSGFAIVVAVMLWPRPPTPPDYLTQLKALAGPHLAEFCLELPPRSEDHQVREAVAAFECHPAQEEIEDVGLYLFDDSEALQDWWSERTSRIDINRGVGDCASGEPGIEVTDNRSLACYVWKGEARLRWIDEDLLLYGSLDTYYSDPAMAFRWWDANLADIQQPTD